MTKRIIVYFCLGIFVGVLGLVGLARVTWHSKFYPGVSIAGISVAGMTREEVRVKLSGVTSDYQMKFEFNGGEWQAPKGVILFELDSSLNAAYQYGRRAQFGDYALLLVNKKTNYPLILLPGKTEKLELLFSEIASSVEIPSIDPGVEIIGGKITITNGVDGTILDLNKLDARTRETATNLSEEVIVIPTVTVKKQLSNEAVTRLQWRAETILAKKLTLTVDDEKIKLTGTTLVKFLATDGSRDMINTAVVTEYVEGIGESINKDPQDARFVFADGKVEEFAPGKDGVEVSVEQTTSSLRQAIIKLLESEEKDMNVEIVVARTPPKVTTDKVNELGIKERIGRGESYYAHSIPNRIYNVALASSRINSALIGPGEEVSFNKMVGEVSGATGYRSAYIIEKGRTVLGDGGGLCQVSTTMFRATMAAGLPILERWGHSYRVSYYELNSKPGVDATVIAPSKDLRFKNDTPGHILIQAINDPKKLHLVIEIYGTNDGRVATISDPRVWGITPPLPTIYQDDPTLSVGTMKQVDWAASGAKASFDYKVVRNGETLQEKTFTTTYRPWASVYLRGTGQ